MTFLYTARGCYDQHTEDSSMSWEQYIKWSKLTHLTELVSLDGMLNEILIEPNRQNEEDWKYIVTDGIYETGFFSSLDYVLTRINYDDKFNLLALVINPATDCNYIFLENYEFIGYELLDKDYCISALTNCGGFDETFSPNDLNNFGLINNYEQAISIHKRLFENNPNEHHADTNIIAVWRHHTIGRT